MPNPRLTTRDQKSAYHSSWSLGCRVMVRVWGALHAIAFRPTPAPLRGWRRWLLRRFGAEVTGRPSVASDVKVTMPWHLTLEDRACLGPGATVYNLGRVTLKARSTVAQEAYLCGGTHDLSQQHLPLVVGEIVIDEDAFVGARAFIMPGVHIGRGAVVGACSVVTRDVEPWQIVAGNPARPIGQRRLDGVWPPEGNEAEQGPQVITTGEPANRPATRVTNGSEET